MEAATLASRTLHIDGMKGEACVQKVTGALKGVEGVTTHSVKVGSANIKSDKAGCDASCAAIGGAGFKAHESKHEAAAPTSAASPAPAAPVAGAAAPAPAATAAPAPAIHTTAKASPIPVAPAR